MAGFNNTPPASEFRRPTSWGRTRSPKNILSNHRSGINAGGDQKVLANGDASVSCITENQRYLHVVVTSASNSTLKIEGEMFAAARDTTGDGKLDTFEPIPLKDTQGNPVDGVGVGHYLIEIGGIDRIKFSPVGDAGAGNQVAFYAACSTFSMA